MRAQEKTAENSPSSISLMSRCASESQTSPKTASPLTAIYARPPDTGFTTRVAKAPFEGVGAEAGPLVMVFGPCGPVLLLTLGADGLSSRSVLEAPGRDVAPKPHKDYLGRCGAKRCYRRNSNVGKS